MNAVADKSLGRVLLVDDDELLLKLGRAQLEKAGFLVLTGRDGKEALEKTRRFKPDAVLVDVLMPGMDGWQVCRALKADPETASIPVFFLTCLGEEEHIHRHRQAEADGYFVKPFRLDTLVQRLLEILEKRQGRDPKAAVQSEG